MIMEMPIDPVEQVRARLDTYEDERLETIANGQESVGDLTTTAHDTPVNMETRKKVAAEILLGRKQ